MSRDVSLRIKIGLPMAGLGIALAVLGWWLMSGQVGALQSTFVEMLARERVAAVRAAMDAAGATALKEAAMFSRLPEVLEAYRQAHAGNIDDPASPQSQAARERLRVLLAPVRAGLKQAMGLDFQLHYHLPNGRSLLRVWREKQAKKNGQWVDISDDLSGFRQTVLDVNAKG
ncbi:MAG: methyl-accepting chemotaxis protein, partial [Desulfovibrionaceae bacterium]